MPGGEAVVGGHDQPGVLRRGGELRVADRGQRQVAERAASLPALVARLGHDTLRARSRVEVGQAREPVDAREAVAGLAARLGVHEVVGQGLRVASAKPSARRRSAASFLTESLPPAPKALISGWTSLAEARTGRSPAHAHSIPTPGARARRPGRNEPRRGFGARTSGNLGRRSHLLGHRERGRRPARARAPAARR